MAVLYKIYKSNNSNLDICLVLHNTSETTWSHGFDQTFLRQCGNKQLDFFQRGKRSPENKHRN